MARAFSLLLLAGMALMGCQPHSGSNATEPTRLRYHPADARLGWQIVTQPPDAATPRIADAVRFRVRPPIQVQGDDLLLVGELENGADHAAVVHLFGVDWQPLTLSIHYTDGMAWKPPYEGWVPQPPAPPPAFRITLPPHAIVKFTGRYDLRTLAYGGNPTALITWRFDYAGTREAEIGTLAVALPPR